ncbi:MAG: AHH domain-containing protein [Gemmatimonadota bacterium]|nr:MAG: AHH domain-containing protein [Gemmatimonadota bacterium]
MTQIGESVAIIPPGGKQKCVFCEEGHQQEKAAGPHTFNRDMSKLKKEGRAYTVSSEYIARYPSATMPPLVEWQRDITGGYKAAAHHCVALKTVSQHALSGELNEAGYDPNDGSNCIWLPYSRAQFIRARACGKALQKHRGGHTNEYFQTVARHLDDLQSNVEDKFCPEKQPDKETVLRWIKIEESDIWNGIANVVHEGYHLYNQSYLNPNAPWGYYEEERNETAPEVLNQTIDPIDDKAAEEESAEDPE